MRSLGSIRGYKFYSLIIGIGFSFVFNLLNSFMIPKIMIEFFPIYYTNALGFSFWNTVVGYSMVRWIDIGIGLLFGVAVFLALRVTKRISSNFKRDRYDAAGYVLLGLIAANCAYALVMFQTVKGVIGIFPTLVACLVPVLYK